MIKLAVFIQVLVFYLILNDSLCHRSVIVSFDIEELTKDPCQLLSLFISQILTLQQIINDLDLLRLDRQEEVSQCIVEIHHVTEYDRLARLQSLDELRCLLNKFKDDLIFLVLLAELHFIDCFRNDEMIEFDGVVVIIAY